MEKTNLKNLGRIFYGLGIVGIGGVHFFFKGFRPLITAIRIENPGSISILIYIFAIYMIVSGILIMFDKKVKTTSIVLAYVLMLFVVVGHLPRRIVDQPGRLGEWTNVLKMLSLIGGAFLVYANNSGSITNRYVLKLARLAPYGRYFFCIMLIAFGIDHFLYVEFVSGLVPNWIPFAIFWTYFTGVALLGAGIAILIGFKIKIVCQLLAIMLFLWLFTVHFRLALKYPEWSGGENITACFQCLAFTGIALLTAATPGKEDTVGAGG